MKTTLTIAKKRWLVFQLAIILAVFLNATCKKSANNEEGEKPSDEDVATNKTATDPQKHDTLLLFDGGTNGYHSFRIPCIVKTNANTLIAFAEGRVNGNEDHGNINVVYRRSVDNGATWLPMSEVAGPGVGTWGNPTAVVDKSNGRIWLFMSWNDEFHSIGGAGGLLPINAWGQRKVYSSYSDDDGITWSAPVDRTTALVPSSFKWDAVGPGIGIQTKEGTLIIPSTGRNIYSTDHGATWNYAMTQTGTITTSEGAIVQSKNGLLMRNDREAGNSSTMRRQVSRGTIENGFNMYFPDNTLIDPKNQGAILRFTMVPDRILVLNSASLTSRGHMRLRISYDDGNTWLIDRRVYDWFTPQESQSNGKGGYSSMIKTGDNMVGMMIEINENTSSNATSNRSIEFHKVNLSWILNGNNEP
jgi:sialidase-1